MTTQFRPLLSETLYDGLGRQAFSTVPVAKGAQALLGFAAGLIADRNPAQGAAFWQGGALHGEISTWIDRGSFARPQDPEYAYQGSYFEPDPVSRTLQTSSQGADFRRESAHAIRLASGDLPEAASSSFQDQLNISSRVQSGYYLASAAETSLGKLGKLTRARLKELDGRAAASVSLDEAGQAILTAKGYTTGAGLSTGLGTNTGTQTPIMSTTQTLQPNYYDPGMAEPANFVTTTQADALGRTVYSYSPDTGITLSYYDTYQRLRFSQTAFQAGNNGKVSPIVIYNLYDALNRIVETGFFPGAWDNETLQGLCLGTGTPQPDGAFPLRQYSYDQLPGATALDPFSQGRLVQTVSWNSSLIGNEIEQSAASQLTETLSYDYKGRITSVTIQLLGGTPYTTQYAYDNLDNITQIIHPDGFTVTYGYNLQGQVNAVGTPATPDYFASYTYNSFGQVATESLAPSSAYPVERSFEYGNSQLQLTGISDSLGLFSESLVYTDGSDNLSGDYQDGNIQTLSVTYGAAVQAETPSYQFDLSYDSFGRLTAVNCPQNGNWSVASLGYDANGNVQNYNGAQYTYAYQPGSNLLQQIQTSVPADDDNFDFDAAGRATAAYDISLSYDESSNLPAEMSNSNNGMQVNLIYDRSGERFQKQSQLNGATSYTQTYIRGQGSWSLADYLTEYGAQVYKRYVYGPLGLIYVACPVVGDACWMLKDHLGSVRVMYDPSSGTVEDYCTYSCFGMPADCSNDVEDYDYLFCSQELDWEMALYNNHARQYDPGSGRFLSPDPAQQYPSPYTYAGNNPINANDPTGRITEADVESFFQADYNTNFTPAEQYPIVTFYGDGKQLSEQRNRAISISLRQGTPRNELPNRVISLGDEKDRAILKGTAWQKDWNGVWYHQGHGVPGNIQMGRGVAVDAQGALDRDNRVLTNITNHPQFDWALIKTCHAGAGDSAGPAFIEALAKLKPGHAFYGSPQTTTLPLKGAFAGMPAANPQTYLRNMLIGTHDDSEAIGLFNRGLSLQGLSEEMHATMGNTITFSGHSTTFQNSDYWVRAYVP